MGRKADRDPNKPKKAMSAYFMFMNEYRAKCKETGEANTSNVTEFTKLASAKWKDMGDSDRKPYEEKAAEAKAAYEEQMTTYVPTAGYGGGKGSRKRKDPDAPKRPKSAYLHYLAQFRAENPQLGHKDVISDGAAAWGRLSDKQKTPYNALYEKEKEEYNQKIQAQNPSADY